MRKIIVSEFVSLDGVMEDPAWTFPYWNDEVNAFKAEEDAVTDALLLGRVTYEMFAAAWPESEDPGAPRMNSMPKYVVSSTLTAPTWNNTTVLSTNPLDEVRALKASEGSGLLVYGSATLVQALLAAGLVDELRLLVYPVVLGSGRRLFADGAALKFEQVSARGLAGGVTGLVYTPAEA